MPEKKLWCLSAARRAATEGVNAVFFLEGACNLSKKKNIANEIRRSVFASVPQSVFLVAASKTDVASKTDSL